MTQCKTIGKNAQRMAIRFLGSSGMWMKFTGESPPPPPAELVCKVYKRMQLQWSNSVLVLPCCCALTEAPPPPSLSLSCAGWVTCFWDGRPYKGWGGFVVIAAVWKGDGCWCYPWSNIIGMLLLIFIILVTSMHVCASPFFSHYVKCDCGCGFKKSAFLILTQPMNESGGENCWQRGHHHIDSRVYTKCTNSPICFSSSAQTFFFSTFCFAAGHGCIARWGVSLQSSSAVHWQSPCSRSGEKPRLTRSPRNTVPLTAGVGKGEARRLVKVAPLNTNPHKDDLHVLSYFYFPVLPLFYWPLTRKFFFSIPSYFESPQKRW